MPELNYHVGCYGPLHVSEELRDTLISQYGVTKGGYWSWQPIPPDLIPIVQQFLNEESRLEPKDSGGPRTWYSELDYHEFLRLLSPEEKPSVDDEDEIVTNEIIGHP